MAHNIIAAFVVASLAGTSVLPAFADEQAQSPAHQQGALAPGEAAGVHNAQFLGGHPLLILLGLGVIAGGVALAVGGHGHHSSSHT
jgi:hypothetical protein